MFFDLLPAESLVPRHLRGECPWLYGVLLFTTLLLLVGHSCFSGCYTDIHSNEKMDYFRGHLWYFYLADDEPVCYTGKPRTYESGAERMGRYSNGSTYPCCLHGVASLIFRKAVSSEFQLIFCKSGLTPLRFDLLNDSDKLTVYCQLIIVLGCLYGGKCALVS